MTKWKSAMPCRRGLRGRTCLFVICVKTIEEMFGDLKGHGFDLESSPLRSFLHLSRLTLAVALLYVWLVTEGAQALIQGRSAQLDRADRPDLSIFRLGLESIEQALTWGEAFFVDFLPVFD